MLFRSDIIDELMGGYWKHINPEGLFNPSGNISKDRHKALEHFRSRLIPDHLIPMNKTSSYFGVQVFLPYGSKEVMDCTKQFSIKEIFGNNTRKKPIYDIAKKCKINKDIIERRKYGLVSAFD